MIFKKYNKICKLIRHFGISWLLGRSIYVFKRRVGCFERKSPCLNDYESSLLEFLNNESFCLAENYLDYRKEKAEKFIFNVCDFKSYQSKFKQWDGPNNSPVEESELILAGELKFFEHRWEKTGFPPNWFRNPITGALADRTCHWSKLGDFGYGDIKVIWEPNRFAFAFTLVRAFARTNDDRYAEAFWGAVEDWQQQNQPNCGVNWKCGQEAALRVMAFIFALNAFIESKVTTPDRVELMASLLHSHGMRIESNISYALSQYNNHGISEAVGLWTLGLVFPEFKDSQRWREKGRRLLIKQTKDLIYCDGSFSQHSINYHRVMLHDLLWAIRLGEINNESLPKAIIDKTIVAGKWLEKMIVGTNGEAPNYGSNDGALLFPLTSCDCQDFRPVVQAIARLDPNNDLPFSSGPWDEESLWFYGMSCLKKDQSEKKENREFSAEQGGYFKFINNDSSLFVRCPKTFRHRPGQADLLHVDLWWKGENVALDPGTYSYNQAPPWDNGLTRTSVHNTVTVDGMDQSDRYGRFLMLPWPKGRVNRQMHSDDRNVYYWEAEHDGYQRLKVSAIHRRGIIRLPNDCWAVVDTVISKKNYPWEVHWLFPDVPYQIQEISGKIKRMKLEMQNGTYSACYLSLNPKLNLDVARADKKSVRGWRSRYYSAKEPANSFKFSITTSNSVFVTVFAPLHQEITIDEDGCQLGNTNFTAHLRFSKNICEARPLVESIFVKTIKDNKITNLAIR